MNQTPIKIMDINLPVVKRIPYNGIIDIWNPTLEDLKNLIPYLEENRKVAFVWYYGDPRYVPDLSEINHYRITSPYWLARSESEAYNMQQQIRKILLKDRQRYDF